MPALLPAQKFKPLQTGNTYKKKNRMIFQLEMNPYQNSPLWICSTNDRITCRRLLLLDKQ